MLDVSNFDIAILLEFVEINSCVLEAIIIQDVHNVLEENYNRFLQRKNMLDEKCYLYYRNVEDLHSYIDSIYTPAYAEKLRRHRKKL